MRGTVLIVFLLVADTLDSLGVDRKGTLGDEGSEENDSGADGELDTIENQLAHCSNKTQKDSPADPPQTALNVIVGGKVMVNNLSKDGTQHSVHDDVRGVQEGHHGAEGGDVGVLGGCGRWLIGGFYRQRDLTYHSHQRRGQTGCRQPATRRQRPNRRRWG